MKRSRKKPRPHPLQPIWIEESWILPLTGKKPRPGAWTQGTWPACESLEGRIDPRVASASHLEDWPGLDAAAAAGFQPMFHPELLRRRQPPSPDCRYRHDPAGLRLFLRRRPGFTLIELLVVIAIISILAGLLLPVLGKVKETARKKQAATELSSLVAAVSQYESTYSRYPMSKDTELALVGNDVTFGLTRTNSELMIILLDRKVGFNFNHERNPRETVFFTARESQIGDGPGLGADDLVLRDPWGVPYVVTMDVNGNNICEDEYYKSTTNKTVHASVVAWSLGPDARYGIDGGTGQDFDADNILSWR